MLVEGLNSLITSDAGMIAQLGSPATRSDQTTGVFPSIAIDEARVPYLVYMQVAREPVVSFDGVNATQEARFRFFCYANTYLQAKQLAEALKLLLDGFVGKLSDGTIVQSTMPLNEIDSIEEQLKATVYGVSLDYYIWFIDQGTVS